MISLSFLPINPGCYQFMDKNNKIIYVGKAKNLKKRVSSYFKNKHLDPKTFALVKNINSVKFIVTNSEVEALILENNLIKKHHPRYNILLKDSKTYSFIELTNESFPILKIVRDSGKKNNLFGPFIFSSDRNNILNFINKTFKLRTCKRLPKKACLRFHINLCCAPCINNVSKSDYEDLINKSKNVLLGKNVELIKKLKLELKFNSKSKFFEKAIIIRDQIKSLKYLNEKQLIQRNKKNNEDFIDYVINNDSVYIIVLKVSNGIVNQTDEFEFDYSPNFFNQFLIQYYSINPVSNEIVLRKNLDSSLVSFLKLKNNKVKIVIPKIADKKKMLKLVKKNIVEKFLKYDQGLLELKNILKLPKLPKIIEGFDISHLSGTNTTASMVQFLNGKPNFSEYRRFKINNINDKIDDVSSMKEVVYRRYKRLLLENKILPDLILIDGGLGQLNVSKKVLDKLQLNIPIIGLTKKFEEIWIPNNSIPIIIDKKMISLKILQQVRNEAHRFAINYNKNLRSKLLK
jgi:excinuclease ABC subunit C